VKSRFWKIFAVDKISSLY